MDPREFVRMIERNWALVIALVLLSGALASGYSLLKTPQYQATAKAVVQPTAATSSLDLTQGTSYAQTAVKTYADIATTTYVLDPVIKRLKLSDTPEQLRSRVIVVAPLDETVLTVTTSDSDPRRAAQIANAVLTQTANAVQTLSPDAASRTASVRMTLVESAAPPASPFSPNVPLNTALGLVLGLVLGLLAAFVRNQFDNGISTARDIGLVTDLPVIGSVGLRRSARRTPIVIDSERSFARVEEYKALRSEILRANPVRRPVALAITSATTRQGVSTTAANLAVSLASGDRRVLLVDANLRHPSVADLLGVDGATGLTDVLQSGVDIDRVIQRTEWDSLSVLAAGSTVDNPGQLFQRLAVETLVENLTARFDVVLIDAPPLLSNEESARLSRAVNGVIVVAASGRSDRVRLQRALTDLDEAGAWVLGVVLALSPGAPSVPRRRPRQPVALRLPEQSEPPAPAKPRAARAPRA